MGPILAMGHYCSPAGQPGSPIPGARPCPFSGESQAGPGCCPCVRPEVFVSQGWCATGQTFPKAPGPSGLQLC